MIEARDVDEALAAARAGFDVIQAEKFKPDDIARLVERISALPKKPTIAAAGGVNAGNAAAYARAGADILVTSAPYWRRRAMCRCGLRARDGAVAPKNQYRSMPFNLFSGMIQNPRHFCSGCDKYGRVAGLLLVF